VPRFGQLGLFCAFLPPGLRPTAKLGSFRTIAPADWVFFAEYSPGGQPGCPRLGLFPEAGHRGDVAQSTARRASGAELGLFRRTGTGRRSVRPWELGLFGAIDPAGPVRRGIGFVSHFTPQTSNSPQLGLFVQPARAGILPQLCTAMCQNLVPLRRFFYVHNVTKKPERVMSRAKTPRSPRVRAFQ
jgi:hypothetical protein